MITYAINQFTLLTTCFAASKAALTRLRSCNFCTMLVTERLIVFSAKASASPISRFFMPEPIIERIWYSRAVRSRSGAYPRAAHYSVSWVVSSPSVPVAASARLAWSCFKKQGQVNPVRQDWPIKQGSLDYANGIFRMITSHDQIVFEVILRSFPMRSLHRLLCGASATRELTPS